MIMVSRPFFSFQMWMSVKQVAILVHKGNVGTHWGHLNVVVKKDMSLEAIKSPVLVGIQIAF